MKRVRLGQIHADVMTFAQALEAIAERIDAATGGFVVTPNVDHVCLAEKSPALQRAYADAALSLVDGMPLVWLSRLLRQRLPERIAGADLVLPLLRRAAKQGWSVFFLGGGPGVAAQAAARLQRLEPQLRVVGTAAPPLGFERDAAQNHSLIAQLKAAQPQVVLVALGCPKQELWMHQHWQQLRPALLLGVGAGIDFLAGRVKRAPVWLQRCGLEWTYRLLCEPRRMAHRYLVRDLAMVSIALRMWRMPPAARSFVGPAGGGAAARAVPSDEG